MKMHLYVSFNEYSTDGINYLVFSQELHERQIDLQKDSSQELHYKHLCEIEVPRIDKSFVLELGLKHVDREIGDLQRKITGYQEKKQELLALDFKAPEDEGTF